VILKPDLLVPRKRPPPHRLRRDNKTLPGALLADIWTRIPRSLRSLETEAEEEIDEEA